MLFYALTIFLSAFLLFQVQPLAGKMILPWFGGSASVWSACMVFFQTTLLGGYLYAHWLHTKLAPRKQAIVHGTLLALSLIVLPIAASPAWRDDSWGSPTLRVLGVLATSVGLPYFLLSTTGPLIQAWYARTHAEGVPYRLYALSNAASMLALISYPVLVEPVFTLSVQRVAWSVGFAAFAAVCAYTAWISARGATVAHAAEAPATVDAPKPSWGECLLWITLAAVASILLLSITRYISQDVAPVPFFWILPLSLYLLSFIFCFEFPRSYWRPGFLVALVLALMAVEYELDEGFHEMHTTLIALSLVLFVICMFCHGELVRRKPHPQHLTLFYVMLSLGGALGGMFVGLLAPVIFNAYFEFPIGLAMCAALAVIVLWKQAKWVLRIAMLAGLGYYCWQMVDIGDYYVSGYLKVVRNFYSQLRVDEVEKAKYGPLGNKRVLYHGRIAHGEQFRNVLQRPTAYYCNETGIGKLLLSLDASKPHRIGLVGLGAGTLAAYGRPGDVMRIYEINPQVLDLAESEFTYLKDSKAKIETVLGDGRLSLEKEPDQHFDVLIMDAFSGDSIPTHLVTLEAVKGYMRHLNPDGVLAMHITNTYLDLKPVVATAAAAIGKSAAIYEYKSADDDVTCRDCDWVFLVSPERVSTLPVGKVLPVPADFRRWTDDYTNLFKILK